MSNERDAPIEVKYRVVEDDGGIAGPLPDDLGARRRRELLVHMMRVRCLDQRMFKLQRAGRIGFAGSMLGMEAAMVGTAAVLRQEDWLWSGLREGGAALMRGLPLSEYIAQMFCNSNDTAKGRQMNNHFQHKDTHYPSWSSVIGTQIPQGVGAAWASRKAGRKEVHAIYFGDGATSSAGFHSGMTLGGVWKVPAVFVCVDNGWAISVSSEKQTAAASYADKAQGYGMPGFEVDGMDVLACYAAMKTVVERARAGAGPALLVVNTYRMLGHSSSDDPSVYRDPTEVAKWQARDPIERYVRHLQADKILSAGEAEEIERRIFDEIDAEIRRQESASPMPLRSLVEDVYAEVPRHLRAQFNDFLRIAAKYGEATKGEGAFPL